MLSGTAAGYRIAVRQGGSRQPMCQKETVQQWRSVYMDGSVYLAPKNEESLSCAFYIGTFSPYEYCKTKNPHQTQQQ